MRGMREYEATILQWIEQRVRELGCCTENDFIRHIPDDVMEAIRMTEVGVGSWLAILADRGKLTQVKYRLPGEMIRSHCIYLPAGTHVAIREGDKTWETKV